MQPSLHTSNLLVIVAIAFPLAILPQEVLAVVVQRPALDAVLQALASAHSAASPFGCACSPVPAAASCAVLQLQQDTPSGLWTGPEQSV